MEVVFVWTWLFISAFAQPLAWDALPERSLDAWEDGPGQRWALQAEGAEHAARGAVAAELTARVEAQLGAVGQDQILGALELPLVGPGGGRRAWQAEGSRRRLEERAARLAFVDEAVDRAAALYHATAMQQHLMEWAAASSADLARYSGAVAAGLLSELALEDLTAEVAMVRVEAARWAVERAAAEQELTSWLGQPVDALEALPAESHVDPWGPLLQVASPEAELATAAAEAATQQAAALGRSTAPRLGLGGMTVRQQSGWVPLAWVGVSVPLTHPDRAERVDQLAAARAASAQASWAEAHWQARLGALSTRWQEEHAWAERYEAQMLEPLERRARRLQVAFDSGLVTAERLVRARREHHEAEHEWLELHLRLAVHEVRAQAWALALEVE